MRAYTRTYTYDKLGNVEQVSHAATGSNYNRNFSYNAGHNTLDEITSGGSTLQTFTYDNSGNQLTSGTTRKTIWNAANQLKAYCNQVGTAEPTVYAQYLYDAGGNRIKKLICTQGGDYETVVYINEMFIYHQKDGEGEKNEISIKDNKSRIACIRVGDTFTGDFPESEYYILEDHLGSSAIRLKHTPGGTKIDREEYYPFGDSSLRTFDKKKYRYVGKEKDSESGLYYYGARSRGDFCFANAQCSKTLAPPSPALKRGYYAAWTCRFISVDPLAAKYAHLNPYNNAGNKVINQKDIDGLQGENEKESQSSKNDSSKNKTDSEVIQSIPEINVHQIPEDYKEVDKQWAIDQKRTGTEESDNLVRAEIPGHGTAFFKKNSEAKVEDKKASESKSQANTTESEESLDESNTIAENENSEAKSNTPVQEPSKPSTPEHKIKKASELGTNITENATNRQIDDNAKVIKRKQGLQSAKQLEKVHGLKSINKTLGSIATFAKGFGLGLSLKDLYDIGNQLYSEFRQGIVKASTIARGIIEIISMSTKASITAIAISISIATAKATGALDRFYKWLDKQIPAFEFNPSKLKF